MPRVKYQAHINNPPKRNSVGRPKGFKDPRKIKPIPNRVGRPPIDPAIKEREQLIKQQEREKLNQALSTFWQ